VELTVNTHRAARRPRRALAVSLALFVASMLLAALLTARRGAVGVHPPGWGITFRVPGDFRPVEGGRSANGSMVRYALDTGDRPSALLSVERRAAGTNGSAAEAAADACRRQLGLVERLTAVLEPTAAQVGAFEGAEVQCASPDARIAVRAIVREGYAYTFTLRIQASPRWAYRRFEAFLGTVVAAGGRMNAI